LAVLEYLDRAGSSPFAAWLESLDATAAAKDVKGVGAGVFEYRIDFGLGYRVYFGKGGDAVVILLAGGTKKRQGDDIATAHDRWADYKKRKAQET
jgi:putative addiction module killer protein